VDIQLLHTLFEEKAAQSPDRIAIEQPEDQISYADLNRFANRIAHALRALNTQKEWVVGTFLPSGIGLVASLLGIFKAGDVYLPLDMAFSKRRLRQIFQQTACNVIVTEARLADTVKQLLFETQIPVEYLVLLEEGQVSVLKCEANRYAAFPLALSQEAANPELAIAPEDGNYLFYTSGSTGEEKAILGCHKGLSHFVQWEIKEFGVDNSWRVSQLSQITFDASLRDILVPLCTGATLCIAPAAIKTNVIKLIAWLEESRVTLVHCVPSILRLITKELMSGEKSADRFPDLKHLLMAGEALFVKDITNWRQAVGEHVELVNLYGTSETTLAKTFHRIGPVPEDPAQVIHVGSPISNAFIAIINDKNLCRIGEIGEIYIKTPFMTKGYYRNEALSQTVFVPNPLTNDAADIVYKTGDLGRYLKDRSVEVLGRTDDQVKVNGIRVELKEIEQAVLRMEGVNETTVVAHKNDDNQTDLICYYIGKTVSAELLRAHLKAELNDNVTPSYLIPLTEFPLSINGKVDKKALPKPSSLVMKAGDYEAPQTIMEKKLEEIWKQALGLKQIGRKVSFFEIGGNSLKGIQIISKIYKELGVLVKINELFTHQSIKDLSAVVAKAARQVYKAIPALAKAEYYELSNAQKRLWIIDQFEQEKAAYNVFEAVAFRGVLNKDAFIKALETVVKRHEILRTVFCLVDGQPKQKILTYDEVGFRVPFYDLRADAAAKETVQKLKAAETSHGFDLEQGPLIRASLIQLADDGYEFLLTTHHVISDEHSLEVITKEMFALYDAFLKGTDHDLPALKIHYKDYAAWHNAWLNGEQVNEAKQYWLNQFSGEIPVLRLDTDFARPLVKTYNSDRLWFALGPETSASLKGLKKKYGTTSFITLLSLIKTWLYKASGQEDIVVGVPVTGREHPDLEDQIGFYVNSLALRSTFRRSDTFEDLLLKVKSTTTDAFEHKAYPFDTLVDDLDIARDRSRNPLFDVGFTFMEIFRSTDTSNAALSTVEMDSLFDFEQHIRGDLWFRINESDDDFIFILCYNTDLFKASYVEKMITDLKFMLPQVLENPRIELETLARLTAENQLKVEKANQKTIKSRNLESLKNVKL